MDTPTILEDYKKQCEQLFKTYKAKALSQTALKSSKEKVKAKDLEIFEYLFREFTDELENISLSFDMAPSEVEKELNSIFKVYTTQFSELGRQLTDRL